MNDYEVGLAILLGTSFVLAVLFFFAALYVVQSIFLMKLFKKTGLVEGWMGWVPFLRDWKFLELGGYPGWIVLLLFTGFIPLIGWIGAVVAAVFAVMAAYQISLKFGKDGAYAILYFFLSIVWCGILAFGKSVWDDARGTRRSLLQPLTTPQPPQTATGFGQPAGTPPVPQYQPTPQPQNTGNVHPTVSTPHPLNLVSTAGGVGGPALPPDMNVAAGGLGDAIPQAVPSTQPSTSTTDDRPAQSTSQPPSTSTTDQDSEKGNPWA
jgi:apolipoprotein N-acyltransferase